MKNSELSSLLLQIGKIITPDDIEPDEKTKTKTNVNDLVEAILENRTMDEYKLDEIDIKIISAVWYNQVVERMNFIDPVNLLEQIFESKQNAILHLDRLTILCRKGLLYTEKKRIQTNSRRFMTDPNPEITFFKYESRFR